VESLGSYLHFVLIIQPILFAVQLFTYRGMFSKPHRVLGYYMVLITFYFFVNAGFLTVPLGIDNLCHVFIVPLFIALNPFYYLYVKSLTSEGFRFSSRMWLHFVPAVVMLIFSIIGVAGNFIPNLRPEAIAAGAKSYSDFLFFATGVPTVLFAIAIYYVQFIAYTILMVVMLVRHKQKLAHFFSYTENISLNWLWIFIAIYMLFSSFDAIVYFTSIFKTSKEIYFLIMILFINFLGYFGIKQTDIYLVKLRNASNDFTGNDTNLPKVQELEVEVASAIIDEKYSGSSLTDEQKNLLLNQLIELMNSSTIYNDSNLTISDVASKLKTNYKYISQVINEKLSKNFYNFVNEYRVEAAMKMMKNHEFDNLSLEGIAGMVGFRSRSAFNNAFKKVTGFPPSHYLKS
jgi:AraC-like DNA-binding protein